MKTIVVLMVFIALLFTTETKNIAAKIPEFRKLTSHDEKQIHCLAKNIYFEAKGEPEKGKVAVAFVTMNRIKSGLYPNDVCSVVTQKTGSVCQFSWFCQKKALTQPDSREYNKIVPIAYDVYINHQYMRDPTRGALFFHADYVAPSWSKRFKRTEVIGRHIFYKPENI